MQKFCEKLHKISPDKMKLCTTMSELEFLMGFVNLFTSRLVQRFLVFSRKRILLHIRSLPFGHLRLLYGNFLLITLPTLSRFCRRVPQIHRGLLLSPCFYFQKCSRFHYLSLHRTRGRFVFSGHNDQFQQVTYGHFFVVL